MPNRDALLQSLSRIAGEGGSTVGAGRVRAIAPSPQSSPPAGEREQVGDRTNGEASAGRRVCVGVVAGAHGVRGAVRIKSFTAEPRDVARYGKLSDEAGQREFSPRLIGVAKGVVLVKFTGVVDRDAAEALRGCRLYLPRGALPPPDDEEYYHADLIGLDAVLEDGTRLGRVQAVHDFGAGDCLEIVRPAGPPAMVPFTRAVVPVIDIAGGRVVIDPPPGLLEAAPREEHDETAEIMKDAP